MPSVREPIRQLSRSCEDRPKEIWGYGFALAQILKRGSAEGMPLVRRGL